jgi:hypothetical protein
MNSRPRPVTVVGAFFFLAAAIAAVVGTSLLFPNPLLDLMWEWNKPGAELFRAIGPASGVFLWALSIAVFTAAIGLLRGRRWAWWFAVALFVVDGSGDVISYFVTHDLPRTVVGAAVSSTFVFVLTRPVVRRYFEQQI